MNDYEVHYDLKWTIPKYNGRAILCFLSRFAVAVALIDIPLIVMIYLPIAGFIMLLIEMLIVLRFTHKNVRAYFKRQLELNRLYRVWKLTLGSPR